MYRPTSTVYPRLAYADEAAAIAWLIEAFGFQERDRKENADGSVLAWLELSGGVVLVCRAGYGLLSPDEAGGVSEKTVCYVDDVVAHHGRAKAAGAVIDRELDDTPWGDRRYEAIDPQGHRWHFAQNVGA
jgi:uncharacterized glyoxalase superfamily protein PhnB